MKWKNRKAELERLRRKHRGKPRSAPKLEQRDESARRPPAYPSLSEKGVSAICFVRREPSPPPSHLIVGTPHKQGPMVMSRDELPWAGGKKS
jgi:hypothetical protein